jgi:AcrR family transcriptional regulator
MADSSLRVPRQDRSRRSLEAIYAAAVTLLAEGGWDAVTVGEIERRSGISRGTFYLRFSTRDDLVSYVHERLISELRELQDDSFGPHLTGPALSTEDAALAVVSAMSEVFREFGRVMVRSVNLDRRPSGAEALIELRRYTATTLRRGAPDADDAAVDFAVRLCFAAFVARQRETAPGAEIAQLDESAFTAQLAIAIAAYLRAVAD